MATDPIRHLTIEEYLAFERLAETKHEYIGGEAFAMAGASARHNLIVANLIADVGAILLNPRLKSG